MIDVVFLLLIFFMCAMSFKVPEGNLQTNLPKQGAPARQLTEREKDLEFIVIKVDSADGEPDIRVNDLPCAAVQELEEKLVTLHSMVNVPIIIDSRPYVPFQYVISVLNACVKARFADISFATPAPA